MTYPVVRFSPSSRPTRGDVYTYVGEFCSSLYFFCFLSIFFPFFVAAGSCYLVVTLPEKKEKKKKKFVCWRMEWVLYLRRAFDWRRGLTQRARIIQHDQLIKYMLDNAARCHVCVYGFVARLLDARPVVPSQPSPRITLYVDSASSLVLLLVHARRPPPQSFTTVHARNPSRPITPPTGPWP
jgi:hypothetical protein